MCLASRAHWGCRPSPSREHRPAPGGAQVCGCGTELGATQGFSREPHGPALSPRTQPDAPSTFLLIQILPFDPSFPQRPQQVSGHPGAGLHRVSDLISSRMSQCPVATGTDDRSPGTSQDTVCGPGGSRVEPACLPLCPAWKFPSSGKGTSPWVKAHPSDPNVITAAKPHFLVRSHSLCLGGQEFGGHY